MRGRDVGGGGGGGDGGGGGGIQVAAGQLLVRKQRRCLCLRCARGGHGGYPEITAIIVCCRRTDIMRFVSDTITRSVLFVVDTPMT